MKRLIVGVIAVAVSASLLSGCGFFGRNKSDYRGSQESRPLEVPPDLDTPSTSNALAIPAAGSGSTAAAAPVDAAPAGLDGGDRNIGTESTLALTDGVSGAWRRVGLALDRAEIGEVTARDETAATFTVKTTITEREQGFFGKIFGREKVSVGEATRVVHIVPNGEASTVQIEDESGTVVDDAAARKIITALKARLG